MPATACSSPPTWNCRLVDRKEGRASSKRTQGPEGKQFHELGHVLAWLTSLANQLGLSLDEAVARYAGRCPRASPCGVGADIHIKATYGSRVGHCKLR
jgi:hypothetical protein